MIQYITPTTIPYLVRFDGRHEMMMYNEEGFKKDITPFGDWFCCRGKIEGKEFVVIFDNKCIIPIRTVERVFLDYLFNEHVTIGESCFSYKIAFEDFNKNNIEYKFQI